MPNESRHCRLRIPPGAVAKGMETTRIGTKEDVLSQLETADPNPHMRAWLSVPLAQTEGKAPTANDLSET